MEINQPSSVKSKMRGSNLRSGVNWQGVLKQKDVKQMCLKQGLYYLRTSNL